MGKRGNCRGWQSRGMLGNRFSTSGAALTLSLSAVG
jgi:hypothetical protein